MRTVCGSDELKVLQHITDAVVDELSALPAYKDTDKTRLYHRVGKHVFKACDSGNGLSDDELKRVVLAKLQD